VPATGHTALLDVTENGLYCAEADFYVDPWSPVERALITHAHSDHAVPGCRQYLTARTGERVLRARLDPDALVEAVEYGQAVEIDGVRVSFHPAGHILEPLKCHVFVTESTFGLPIYRWPQEAHVQGEINDWWRSNQGAGKASVLFVYPLGKAQRVLAGLDPGTGPIHTHGAVERFAAIYREQGVALPRTIYAGAAAPGTDWSRAIILAPPSFTANPWLRRFGPLSTGFASGWMRIRGTRRRRSVDRGFVLSDHADWPGLLAAIETTGAKRVWVTHGYRGALVRWLRERGLDAQSVETRFEGERDETPEEPPEAAP
jgi:putative mRNA 3-end processing factor